MPTGRCQARAHTHRVSQSPHAPAAPAAAGRAAAAAGSGGRRPWGARRPGCRPSGCCCGAPAPRSTVWWVTRVTTARALPAVKRRIESLHSTAEHHMLQAALCCPHVCGAALPLAALRPRRPAQVHRPRPRRRLDGSVTADTCDWGRQTGYGTGALQEPPCEWPHVHGCMAACVVPWSAPQLLGCAASHGGRCSLACCCCWAAAAA